VKSRASYVVKFLTYSNESRTGDKSHNIISPDQLNVALLESFVVV